MTEHYLPIRQASIACAAYECIELRDGRDGLAIELVDEKDCSLLVRFDDFLAYRRLDEGDALKIIATIKPAGAKAELLYTVSESEFIKWFHEQSYNIHCEQQLMHYMIVTQNDLIDVISVGQPKIEQMSDIPKDRR